MLFVDSDLKDEQLTTRDQQCRREVYSKVKGELRNVSRRLLISSKIPNFLGTGTFRESDTADFPATASGGSGE